ncbi:hypothetical protein PF005_g4804 [Phytophthora fragariae]|uniref:Tetratricopeptide repeat n=1 Tax=Phytophthora fragariae TaxID=53985 RepID=A0A6A3YYD2_9STRA|nr:hypothetical protein PF007_g5737 [Phytophthora fragariae]KAE9227203.1 hypothetical protein PF005_g4804 [Phytophthora fragariae]
MLSSTVACLKQKNMDLEALGCLEQSLWLKRRMFGVDNSVVHKALNEVMLSYNSVAMQYLAQGQFDQCLAMLRKAEAITAPGNFKRCQALQILTFNNIGCCYRKLGKLKSALKYLKEAAQIGSGSAHVKNLSITHLNLCAIQSQLGRHDLALEHAQAAIFHTQEELVSLEDEAMNERDEDGECDGDDRDQAALVDALDPKTREEKIISLAVAYHNLAVELEFNGRGEASLQWYKKALQLVWKYRETNEALYLPAKRVGHMEYLRRMKKLAENIKDDLNGVGTRPSAVKPVELAANNTRSPRHLKEEINPANSECGSRVSTPRSATSKLRDRIEQARRDSWGSLHEADALSGKSDQVQPVALVSEKLSAREDDGIELVEDANVFESEVETRDAELQLFRVAAGSRLQAFFRGQRCRIEVNQLKQVKLEHDSATLIQNQARQYLETLKEERRIEAARLQLELQKEEVEDMAACLIQRLCRRVLSRTTTLAARNDADEDEDDKPFSVPQRRPFSVADVALGAAVTKSVGSIPTLLNQDERLEPPRLNSASTVPRINLNHPQDQQEPHRSFTMSSIPPGGVDMPTKVQTEASSRSDVYADDEEWKSPPPCSTNSTPRTARSTTDPSSRSTAATPRTSDNTAQQVDTKRQNAAAVCIQALIKSFCVRQRIAQDNAGDMSRTYIERKHFSVALDRALELEQEFLEELSAVKVQALVRGHQSRLLTECMKAGVYTAASTIQRSFRVHRHNTQRAVDDGVRSIAARAIQQVYRDYEARRVAIHQAAVQQELVSVQEIAASTIQNFWKQYFTTRDHCLEEIEAATCIQALGRGHLTRKSMKSLHGSSSSGFSKHSSAFSMSSSAEKLVEEDESVSERKEQSLSINYSFLPASIRELFVSSSGIQPSRTNSELHAEEIAELGLTFADFLHELESCTDLVVGSSALDAMRIVVETSPGSTKTLANVVKVAQTLDRRLQEGFWNEAIEASSIALLQAFRDVLDAQ